MPSDSVRSFSLDTIDQIANDLTRQLHSGDVVALSGNLASGKTTLTKALLENMGYKGRVSSPTFVLERRYPVDFHGIKTVHHLDFYRLNEEQLASFDWQDYMGEPESLTIIEWPERLKELPAKIKQAELTILSQNDRQIKLFGSWETNDES